MFSTPSKLSAALFAGLLLALQPVHARTVRDINNQSVELPQQVNRIADLWPANNQVVLMLGGATCRGLPKCIRVLKTCLP